MIVFSLLFGATNALVANLGKSIDVANSNLFTMAMLKTNVIFDWPVGTLTECDTYPDSSCSQKFSAQVQKVTSIQSVGSTMQKSNYWNTDLNAVAGVVDFSMGMSGSSSSQSTYNNDYKMWGYFGENKFIDSCHSIDTSCLMPTTSTTGTTTAAKIPFDTVYLEKINYMVGQMPSTPYALGSTQRQQHIQEWQTELVATWGTHAIMGTANGAAVRTTTLSKSHNQTAQASMAYKTCGTLNVTVPLSPSATNTAAAKKNIPSVGLNAGGCGSGSGSHNSDYGKGSFQSDCTAIGGLQNGAGGGVDACGTGTAAANARYNFLFSGDYADSSTVVDLDLMELPNLLATYLSMKDFPLAAKEKYAVAIKYHLCMTMPSDRFTWQWIDETCKCTLACQNGGTLDATSCTCKCAGDVYHGFSGETCTSEYGMCQPGTGTGNWGAASKCGINGGWCSSDFHSAHCTQSEVCCATDFGTNCCPYGNSCDCGTGSCSCVSGSRSIVTETAALEERSIVGSFVSQHRVVMVGSVTLIAAFVLATKYFTKKENVEYDPLLTVG